MFYFTCDRSLNDGKHSDETDTDADDDNDDNIDSDDILIIIS